MDAANAGELLEAVQRLSQELEAPNGTLLSKYTILMNFTCRNCRSSLGNKHGNSDHMSSAQHIHLTEGYFAAEMSSPHNCYHF